jgi:glyoxylase-like metal-dependent hydrolase (beta-lactamase superfamily II)
MSSLSYTDHSPTVLDLHFQGEPQAIASYLLIGAEDAALIETGPASTLDSLMEGLASAKVAPERVTKLLLTHIHLDHAGAAGSLTRLLPNATVYVHAAGARHLIDPTKLVASARRIYGEHMDRLWGEVLPVPADRVVVLDDGEVVIAGGRELQALYTPGHASHHIAYWDATERAIHTGDVAGIRLPGVDAVLPPTPPPDLDIELWSGSIGKLMALDAHTLYLTHYGPVHDPREHLNKLDQRLYEWRDLVLAALREGRDETAIAQQLEEQANYAFGERARMGPALRARYGLVASYAMNVAGYVRYLRK